jgi:hypothetical protein
MQFNEFAAVKVRYILLVRLRNRAIFTPSRVMINQSFVNTSGLGAMKIHDWATATTRLKLIKLSSRLHFCCYPTGKAILKFLSRIPQASFRNLLTVVVQALSSL